MFKVEEPAKYVIKKLKYTFIQYILNIKINLMGLKLFLMPLMFEVIKINA